MERCEGVKAGILQSSGGESRARKTSSQPEPQSRETEGPAEPPQEDQTVLW